MCSSHNLYICICPNICWCCHDYQADTITRCLSYQQFLLLIQILTLFYCVRNAGKAGGGSNIQEGAGSPQNINITFVFSWTLSADWRSVMHLIFLCNPPPPPDCESDWPTQVPVHPVLMAALHRKVIKQFAWSEVELVDCLI